MVKENKRVAFSTRFTESMDKALDELSDVKMITKHDLVRVALSDYLLRNKGLIDGATIYKSNENALMYDSYGLVTVASTNSEDGGRWVQGIDFDDKGEPSIMEDLVKIEINIPLTKEKEKIPELIALFKSASDEDKEALQGELMKLVSQEFSVECMLRYTEKGLMLKEEPRLMVYVQKCMNELIEDINKGKI